MKDTNSRKKLKKPRRDAPDIGVVRVASNPGPDAEDRLRRLFSLLVRYATQDRPPSTSSERALAPGEDSPSDAPPAEDHAGEEG